MSLRKLTVVFAVAGLVLSGALSSVIAQSESSRVSYKTLAWDDYHVDDTSPGMAAQTQTYFAYRYEAQGIKAGDGYTARVTKFEYYGGLDKAQTWRRSKVDTSDMRLLKHEQGHLDMNELYVRKMQQIKMADLPTGAGKTPQDAFDALSKKLKQLYRTTATALQTEQQKYDAETKHGTVQDKQREWGDRLNRDIVATSPSTPQTASATK